MTAEEKREYARKKASDWYYANKDRARATRGRYKEKNRDRLNALARVKRELNKERDKEKNREYQKAWRDKNADKIRRLGLEQYYKHRDKTRDRYFRKLYGISLERRYEMEEQQGGACAICLSAPKTSLHVDHCHLTGVVRGLLCYNCNDMIGRARDSIHTLQRAVEYLGAPL